MTDDKRAALKERIEAAQHSEAARSARKLGASAKDSAIEAKDKFTAFAREHPVATVAGGVVLGLVVASFFKAPRKAAARTGAKAAGLAALGSELALGVLSQLRANAEHAGEEGKRKLADASDSVSSASRDAGKALLRLIQRN